MTVVDEQRRTTEAHEVRSGYFDTAWRDQDDVIERAREQLAGIDFDTFVATGLSGAAVVGLLAHALGKNFLILRKPDDISTHSSKRAVGRLGKRWIFLDDFVSSGNTLRRVHDQMVVLVANENADRARNYDFGANGAWGPAPLPPIETTYVGAYMYSRMEGFASPGRECY